MRALAFAIAACLLVTSCAAQKPLTTDDPPATLPSCAEIDGALTISCQRGDAISCDAFSHHERFDYCHREAVENFK